MKLKEFLQQHDHYIFNEEQLRGIAAALDKKSIFKDPRRRFLIKSGDYVNIFYIDYNKHYDYGYIEGGSTYWYYETMEELAYNLLYELGFEEPYGEVYSLQTFDLVCEF